MCASQDVRVVAALATHLRRIDDDDRVGVVVGQRQLLRRVLRSGQKPDSEYIAFVGPVCATLPVVLSKF